MVLFKIRAAILDYSYNGLYVRGCSCNNKYAAAPRLG